MPNAITRFFNLINDSTLIILTGNQNAKKQIIFAFTLSAFIPATIVSVNELTTEQNDALLEATGYNAGFNSSFLFFGIYETIIFTTNLALSLSQKYYNRPQLPNGPANTLSRNFNNAISKYILLSRTVASIYAITHASLSAESFNKVMQENHTDAGANIITFLTYFGVMSLLSTFCVLATCLFCCAGFYPCRHPEELRENLNRVNREQLDNALARPLNDQINSHGGNAVAAIEVEGQHNNQLRQFILNPEAINDVIAHQRFK